jgi:oligoribonuclease NrnB/cAMP/cGMP phosphodiesterase (DHH superfamily)
MLLHISHNDLDGVSCGVLTKKFLREVDNIFCNYNEIDHILAEVNTAEYERILITDMSPSKRAFDRLLGEIEIIVIDHHESSVWLKEMTETVHDIKKCATLLTFEWLKDMGKDVEPYRELVECVNDFDMWHLKRKDSLQMNMLFMKLGVERYLERFSRRHYTGFSVEEQLIVELETERRDKYIHAAAKSGFAMKDAQDLDFFVVFAEEYSSELGNHIIKELEMDYVIIINMQRRKVSLRSRPAVDVRLLAERNGGGGHKNAAGFGFDFDFGTMDFLHEIGVIDEG